MSDDVRHIAFRSVWRYVGPGPGRGEDHIVIDPNPPKVITMGAERSWLGQAEIFVTHFRLVNPGPNAAA